MTAAIAPGSSRNRGRTRAADRGLAGHRVDDDRDRDEALVAEDAPVAQRLLADVTDLEAIDIDIAAVDRAGDRGQAVDQVHHHAVLGEHHPLGGQPGRLGQPAMRAQVPHSPCTASGARAGRVQHVQQLAGRGVPDTCTIATSLCSTVAPQRDSPLITP